MWVRLEITGSIPAPLPISNITVSADGDMAAITTGQPQLLTLPLELLHMVVALVGKKELKALRISNKYLHKLATPVLFESFAIYPHTYSLEKLVNVAKSPHLAPCVRELKYDATFVAVPDTALSYLRSLHGHVVAGEEKERAIVQARLMSERTLRADNRNDELALLAYLEDAFASLPNLRSIQVIDGHSFERYHDQSLQLPSFYKDLVEKSCDPFAYTRLGRGLIGPGNTRMTYAHATLMALRKLKYPLENFDAQMYRWSYLLKSGDLAKHAQFWGPTVAGLKSLRLAVVDGNAPVGSTLMSNLQTVLRTAANLEKLSITFREIYDARSHREEMKDERTGRLFRSLFQPHLSEPASKVETGRLSWSNKLHTLCLDGLVCTMEETQSVLKRSAESLKVLTLSNFVLVPHESSGPRACLVELFDWMRKHLQLEEVKLRGYLTNEGMQEWSIHPSMAADNSLLNRVQKFIVNGGPNPLTHVAINPGYFDLHKRTKTVDVPESLQDTSFSGDASFTMNYEEDDEDKEDSEEEFDNTSSSDWDDDDIALPFPPPNMVLPGLVDTLQGHFGDPDVEFQVTHVIGPAPY